MALIDTFSKRMRRQRGEVPEVLRYDILPDSLRVQIVQIWSAVIGDARTRQASDTYEEIARLLRRERGVFSLTERQNGPAMELAEYFFGEPNVELALDVVELVFRVIDKMVAQDKYWTQHTYASQDPVSGIGELNRRFLEQGVGYQYEGEIVRIDSKFVHAEVVIPALRLLAEKRYAPADEEFRGAHEHYRRGRHKEALVDALKAFESVLKITCEKRHWKYDKTATSRGLIQVCFEKGLVPPYLETQFSSLRSLLESGAPTVRNKNAGHGQGTSIVDVPQHLAAYGLALAASSIVFVVQCERALP